MSDNIPDNIVQRLRKLLALAGNNSNEHEASAALAKAQALMEEYNLTVANIEAGGKVGEAPEDPLAVREKAKSVGRALYQYQRSLMQTIADVNFCFVTLREYREVVGKDRNGYDKYVTRKGYQLIGRKANVITVEMMFDYLNETMERLVPITDNKQRLSRSAISWKEGFAHRVIQRILTAQREKERDAEREARERAAAAKNPAAPPSSGTALMLVDVAQNERDLNEDMRFGYEPGTTARRRAEAISAHEERKRLQALQPQAVTVQTVASVKPETEAERKARLKQEEKDRAWWERYQAKQRRAEERKWANKDMHAYYAGAAAGQDVSLDTQIGKEDRKGVK